MAITTRTATTEPQLDAAAPPTPSKTATESKDRRNRRVAVLAVGGFAALAVVGTAAGIVLATRSAPSTAQPAPTVAGPTTTLPNDAAESAHGAGEGIQFFSGYAPTTGTNASPEPIEVAHGAGSSVLSTSGSRVR